MPSRPSLVLAALAALVSCASPDGALPTAPAAPSPAATPRPLPPPALVVLTALRTRTSDPTPAFLSLYSIGADGRLTAAGPPQAIGPLYGVRAVSYAPATGLYRQVVTQRNVGALTLVTYRLDLETGVFTHLADVDLPVPGYVAAFHPSGRYLYTGAGAQAMTGYELDPGNGVLLRAIPGAPFTFAAPMSLSHFSVAPSGRFAWGQGRIRDGYHHNNGFVVTFAVDPATGALRTSTEARVWDQQSDLAVATGEDRAYVLDRSEMAGGQVTWRRFRVDGAGDLEQRDIWNARVGGLSLRFTRSDRFLLALSGGDLSLLEIGASGQPSAGPSVAVPRSEYWDARRVLLQVGAHAYVGGDRAVRVVRVDEGARTLELVQDLTPVESDSEILAVALSLPAS